MEGSIEIIKEVFNDDVTLKPPTTAELFTVPTLFILCAAGTMLLLYQSLLYGVGFVLLIIFFPLIGFLNLLFNYPSNLLILIGFIAFSIGYMPLIAEGMKRYDLGKKSSKYVIVKHSLGSQLVAILGLICPLFWYIICAFGYYLLKPPDEIRKWDLDNIKEGLKHLQSIHIGYFNNLRTKTDTSESDYNEVKKQIEELKKGVVAESVYIFKLTEEGYKKLILTFETIKEHEFEIHGPIEPIINRKTEFEIEATATQHGDKKGVKIKEKINDFELEPDEEVLNKYEYYSTAKRYPVVFTNKQIYHLEGWFFRHTCKIPYTDIIEVSTSPGSSLDSCGVHIYDSSGGHYFSNLVKYEEGKLWGFYDDFKEFTIKQVLDAKRKSHRYSKTRTEFLESVKDKINDIIEEKKTYRKGKCVLPLGIDRDFEKLLGEKVHDLSDCEKKIAFICISKWIKNPFFVTDNWLIGEDTKKEYVAIPREDILLYSFDHFVEAYTAPARSEEDGPHRHTAEIGNRLKVYTRDRCYEFTDLGIFFSKDSYRDIDSGDVIKLIKGKI